MGQKVSIYDSFLIQFNSVIKQLKDITDIFDRSNKTLAQ